MDRHDDDMHFVERRKHLGIYVSREAALNHTSSGNWQIVTFDTKLWDPMGMYSTSSGKATIPSNMGGRWLCAFCVTHTNSTTGGRSGRLSINSSSTVVHVGTGMPATNQIFPTCHLSKIIELNPGDTVEVQGFQNQGANNAYIVGEDETWFQMTYLGREQN